MKLITLVEGYDVQLHPNPDYQGGLEPNAYVGQRFRLNGKPVVIVSNTMLTFTIRYLTVCERIKEYINAYIRRIIRIRR